MEQETACNNCPKCGRLLLTSFLRAPSDGCHEVPILFKCLAPYEGGGCDFEVVLNLPIVNEEIVWPTRQDFLELFKPEYEQAFVLSKIFGQYPEISGPFYCEEDAARQKDYLLYAFPESYCAEFKNNRDARVKLWVLRLSRVPSWVWEHMKKVIVLEPWADFRPRRIADPEVRTKFVKTVIRITYPKNKP